MPLKISSNVFQQLIVSDLPHMRQIRNCEQARLDSTRIWQIDRPDLHEREAVRWAHGCKNRICKRLSGELSESDAYNTDQQDRKHLSRAPTLELSGQPEERANESPRVGPLQRIVDTGASPLHVATNDALISPSS